MIKHCRITLRSGKFLLQLQKLKAESEIATIHGKNHKIGSAKERAKLSYSTYTASENVDI